MSSWGTIAVDLDGTLAEIDYGPQFGVNYNHKHVGPPIPRMVEKVKAAVAAGKNVVIFTARVSTGNRTKLNPAYDDYPFAQYADEAREAVQKWCVDNLGYSLPVTCEKTYDIIEIWDDRAKQVIPNSGVFLEEEYEKMVNLYFGA